MQPDIHKIIQNGESEAYQRIKNRLKGISEKYYETSGD